MTTPLFPNGIYSTLLQLKEYAALLEYYQVYTQFGSPPPDLQDRLTELEVNLPRHLFKYIDALMQKSPEKAVAIVTTLTHKGCCSNCQTAVHPEWRQPVARGEVIYLCGGRGCGAVFVPNCPAYELSSTYRRATQN